MVPSTSHTRTQETLHSASVLVEASFKNLIQHPYTVVFSSEKTANREDSVYTHNIVIIVAQVDHIWRCCFSFASVWGAATGNYTPSYLRV